AHPAAQSEAAQTLSPIRVSPPARSEFKRLFCETLGLNRMPGSNGMEAPFVATSASSADSEFGAVAMLRRPFAISHKVVPGFSFVACGYWRRTELTRPGDQVAIGKYPVGASGLTAHMF